MAALTATPHVAAAARRRDIALECGSTHHTLRVQLPGHNCIVTRAPTQSIARRHVRETGYPPCMVSAEHRVWHWSRDSSHLEQQPWRKALTVTASAKTGPSNTVQRALSIPCIWCCAYLRGLGTIIRFCSCGLDSVGLGLMCSRFCGTRSDVVWIQMDWVSVGVFLDSVGKGCFFFLRMSRPARHRHHAQLSRQRSRCRRYRLGQVASVYI